MTPPTDSRTNEEPTSSGETRAGEPVAESARAGSAHAGQVITEATRPERPIGTITSSGTEATMRISDAAERVGVSSRTLRFYEELGLVSPSGHTAGGARRYAPEDLARIERIQELKEILGLGLEEIKGVLESETRIEELRLAYRENARDSTATARERQRAILQEALERREAITEQLDRKMARMASFRAKLVADATRARELLREIDS